MEGGGHTKRTAAVSGMLLQHVLGCGWARGVRLNADVRGHAPNASAPRAQ